MDEKYSAEGIKVSATDIHEGVVYEANGVKVTAVLVGPWTCYVGNLRLPRRLLSRAYGRPAGLPGYTRPSDNLVKFSRGALIYCFTR